MGAAALSASATGLLARPDHANASIDRDAANGSDLVGEIQFRLTDGNKTLLDIARDNDLGILELSAANPGVDAWIPGDERLLVLPSAHIIPNDVRRDGIIVNLSELRLYFFPPDGGTPVTSSIGIGRDGFYTPVGESSITRKKKNPTWYPTAATKADKPELPDIVGPGPDNPLGHRALYLGWPTYLIHGTNKPLGVGRRISRGCIRMYPERVEALFPKVPVGTPVSVVEQPVKLGRKNGEIFLEAHPDFDQLDQLENSYRFDLKPPIDITRDIIAYAGPDVAKIDWRAVRKALIARRGIPEQITAASVRQAHEPLINERAPSTNGPKQLFPRI